MQCSGALVSDLGKVAISSLGGQPAPQLHKGCHAVFLMLHALQYFCSCFALLCSIQYVYNHHKGCREIQFYESVLFNLHRLIFRPIMVIIVLSSPPSPWSYHHHHHRQHTHDHYGQQHHQLPCSFQRPIVFRWSQRGSKSHQQGFLQRDHCAQNVKVLIIHYYICINYTKQILRD